MKTLIITGVYHPEEPSQSSKPSGVRYNVVLYGQTPDQPAVQFITSFNEVLTGYDHLQAKCRNIYKDYFKTDLFNIISLENLNRAEL